MNAKAQRSLLFAGIIMSTIYSLSFYFLLDFWPIPSPTLSPAEVVQMYAANNAQFRLGVVLMMATGGFWLTWAIVIGIQMARDETGIPVWAITQTLGSSLGTALFLALTPIAVGHCRIQCRSRP